MIFFKTFFVILSTIVGGYFVSNIDKPKFADIKMPENAITAPLDATMNKKTDVKKVQSKQTGVLSKGKSASVDTSLSGEEVLSLIKKLKWSRNPIEGELKMRINANDVVEISGTLNKARLSDAISGIKLGGIFPSAPLLFFLPERISFYVNGSANIVNNTVDLTLNTLQIEGVPVPLGESVILSLEKFTEGKISGAQIEFLNFHDEKMNVKGNFPSRMVFW